MTRVIRPHEYSGKDDFSTSFYYSVVELHDWWLIEAEEEFAGKKLAVAGLPDKMKEEESVNKKPFICVFKSAPITKVFDFCTLETADDVCISLAGLLNKSKTIENGFSEEVFKHFVFGFPVNWETINYDSIRQDSKAAAESKANSFVATISRDKDKSSNEKRSTSDNIFESLHEHDHIQTGNSAEVAPNCIGADLCKAGSEAAQTGPPCPGLPDGSSVRPVSIGKTSCGRMTRSRAAAESVKGVESTVILDLSARRTSGKNIADADTSIRKKNVTAGGSFPGKKSTKMTGAERKDNKTEVSSSRRKTGSKPKPKMVAKSASPKRNDDGRKEELSEKRIKDSPQTPQVHSEDKDKSPDEKRSTGDNIFESLDEHDHIQTGNSTEVAPNCIGDMGADLCKAGSEVAQTGPPCPGSPDGSSSLRPVSIGKTSCGRMTRSRAAAESVKRVESTVILDLSARRTSGKTIADAGTSIGKKNVTADGSFPGKNSKKMTGAERKDNKTEVSSSRRKTGSKPKTERVAKSKPKTKRVAKSASPKRNDDGRKEELSEKRIKDSPQTTQVHSDLQGTLVSSPETFKRSRSGRTLVPKLEFWRNQQPIYNADRSIAGIQEDGGRHV